MTRASFEAIVSALISSAMDGSVEHSVVVQAIKELSELSNLYADR